ncbi:MAG: hypothetical protein Q4F63_08875 [Clostridia bacterium]|nr:hypothetical protein [Clostridia bacterium]
MKNKKYMRFFTTIAVIIFLQVFLQNINKREIVGIYSYNGYAPDFNDLASVPYSYSGKTDNFVVTCNVRKASEGDIWLLLKRKENYISICENSKNYKPNKINDNNNLIEQAEHEIKAIEQADNLYVTEMLLTYSGDSKSTAQAYITISSNKETYFSFYADVNTNNMMSLINTDDGTYSEGILLPKKDSYEMTIKYKNKKEKLTLSLVK